MSPHNAVTASLDAATEQFIQDTARALVYVYRLGDYDPWLWSLGKGDEQSAQAVLENWVRGYVRWVPQRLSRPMFQMLHDEFEQLYYQQEVPYEAIG